MTMWQLALWLAQGFFVVWTIVFSLLALVLIRRERRGYQPNASRTGAPSSTPSTGTGGRRSSEAIVADVRAALDSGRVDASVARINRRNETRRSQ